MKNHLPPSIDKKQLFRTMNQTGLNFDDVLQKNLWFMKQDPIGKYHLVLEKIHMPMEMIPYLNHIILKLLYIKTFMTSKTSVYARVMAYLGVVHIIFLYI